MPPVVQSTQTANSTTSGITITKPTGLAVGDLMIAALSNANASSTDGFSTLSGWTSEQTSSVNSDSTSITLNIQTRIADASDVAASNFTFSTSSAGNKAGVIMRVTGHRQTGYSGVADNDTYFSTATTAISFTSVITPAVNNSLVIMVMGGHRVGTGGAGSMSGYASTPSLTWTEVLDFGVDQGAIDPITAVAWATQATAAQITAYSSTLSLSRQSHAGILFTVYPLVNATGTNALLEVTPTFFNQNGVADTNANASFLEVSPNFSAQSGTGTSPTQWQNEPTGSTTWQNEEY